jgi:hypothetical protein
VITLFRMISLPSLKTPRSLMITRTSSNQKLNKSIMKLTSSIKKLTKKRIMISSSNWYLISL